MRKNMPCAFPCLELRLQHTLFGTNLADVGEASMPAIFISYRRDDNSGFAGRLADSLRDCFGDGQVFRDCDDVAKGASFEQAIREALRSASVMLLVVGPRWLTLADDAGRPRIEGARDYVRLEIETALQSGLPIIPLLLPDARMPAREQLPPILDALSLRQALALRDDRWKDDVHELVCQIEFAGDLEARCSKGTESVRSTPNPAISAVRHFFPDLLLALSRPAGFLIKRNLGRKSDMLYAGTFLCLALLLAQVLEFFGLKEPESGSFVKAYVSLVSVWSVTLLLLSGPLWFAWWLVGARSHYRKVLINWMYQIALFCFLLYLAGVVAYTGLGFYDADVANDVYRIFKEAPPGKGAELVLERLGSVPTGPGTYIAYGLAILINVWMFAWLLRSWVGYRLVLDMSRLQSFLAIWLFLALMSGLPLLSFWLAGRQAAG